MDESAGRSADGIIADLCRRLAENGQEHAATEQFSALDSHAARVNFAYQYLNSFGLFPEWRQTLKNVDKANSLREEGNAFFKDRKIKLAFQRYTESVAHAPCNSESLALAFANRSAVLSEYKLYKECLQDMAYALENNYPERLYPKILNRKTIAERHLPTQTASFSMDQQELPSLSFDSNQLIECAGDCVEIKSDLNNGRHVVATKTIFVGDIIALENPYCRILLKENYLTHCYECLKPCHNLIGCNNCSLVMYCGKSCRDASWTSCHSFECPILGTILDLGTSKPALVALKICLTIPRNLADEILIGLLNHKLENSPYKSENYYEIHYLVANTEERTRADLFERSTLAAMIFELVQKNTAFYDESWKSEEKYLNLFKELLLHHMQTGPCNFHEISELTLDSKNCRPCEVVEIGAGAYAFLSLLNHSCCPNVVRHCYGSCIALRAIRLIKPGQQLFDNYGYHHAIMVKKDRQKQLKDQYYFDCACEACTNDWPLYHNLKCTDIDIGCHGNTIEQLRNGCSKTATTCSPELQKMAFLLETFAPCKEMADVQEILKQCYAIAGNRRVDFE